VKSKDVESENVGVAEESEDEEVDEEFFEESEDGGVDEESEDEEVDEEFFEEFKDEGVNNEYEDVIDLADINDEVEEEFEDVLDQSEIDKKIEALKKDINQVEISYEFKDALDESETEKKIEALRKKIEDSGASSLEDLTQDLKDKLLQLKEAVKSEMGGGRAASLGLHINHPLPLSEFRERNKAINNEIEHTINNSPDLTDKMERLELAVKKAGKRPDLETKNKIRALEREIKQDIDEALKSSEKYVKLMAERGDPKVEMVGMLPNFETISEILVSNRGTKQGIEGALNSSKKYNKLMAEISEVNEPSGVLDGSLKEENVNQDDSKHYKFKLADSLEANRSFA